MYPEISEHLKYFNTQRTTGFLVTATTNHFTEHVGNPALRLLTIYSQRRKTFFSTLLPKPTMTA